MRKVYVTVTTKLIIRADEGVDIDSVLADMDATFVSNNDGANIEESLVEDWQITDSK